MTRTRDCLAGVLVAALALASGACAPERPLVEWIMVAASWEPNLTADAHLLALADGRTVLIDAATRPQAEATLIPLLRSRGIGTLDLLVITHAHENHYGGINALLDSGVTIRRAVVGTPQQAVCVKEDRCDWDHFTRALERLRASGTSVAAARAGETLVSEPVGLSVPYAFDGVHTPAGRTDINDTSAIVRLRAGRWSVLFTADLNDRLGRYLAQRGEELQADLMTVPHHGTESAAPDAFFDRVSPKAVLVSAPAGLWQDERSARLRRYFETRAIPAYVSGTHGHVTVRLFPERYEIRKARG